MDFSSIWKPHASVFWYYYDLLYYIWVLPWQSFNNFDNNLIFLNLKKTKTTWKTKWNGLQWDLGLLESGVVPIRLGHLLISECRKTVGGWAQSKHLLVTGAGGKFSSEVVYLTIYKLCSFLMLKNTYFLSDYRYHC